MSPNRLYQLVSNQRMGTNKRVSIPRLDKVPSEANDRQQDEQACSPNICPSKERILSTDPCHRRDHDRLGATVFTHRESYGSIASAQSFEEYRWKAQTIADRDIISSLGQDGAVVATIELGEGRQASGPHPVLEVFVRLEVWRWVGGGVAPRVPFSPVGRR